MTQVNAANNSSSVVILSSGEKIDRRDISSISDVPKKNPFGLNPIIPGIPGEKGAQTSACKVEFNRSIFSEDNSVYLNKKDCDVLKGKKY